KPEVKRFSLSTVLAFCFFFTNYYQKLRGGEKGLTYIHSLLFTNKPEVKRFNFNNCTGFLFFCS
ncbi:MAG TPA: hypothetical protein DD462_14310, partial [Leeuwenhoekiella sp.]|nr:hypothetical protein [Leeuwenhoekiella sp.]